LGHRHADESDDLYGATVTTLDPTRIIPTLIDECLAELGAINGTDVIITAGARPLLRIDGQVRPAAVPTILDAGTTHQLITMLLGGTLTDRLIADKQVDFAFTWRGQSRVRGNAFMQKGSTALALRMLPLRVPGMHELGLPATVQSWTRLPRGLVLITGPTGSGKSTTLASMIDHINTYQARHVITIEDPIEYYHEHKRSAINQREVGTDVHSFADGLRAVLREDPDVVLIGEMRDPESIEAALTIAETGHLVFTTLHTNDTAQALDRIVDVIPTERQPQVRLQLAHTLGGVLHQLLIPRIDGGRVAAFDVLNATQAVRNLIREGHTRQIRNVIMTGQRDGMQTLESSLSALVEAGMVHREVAQFHSLYPHEIAAPRVASV
jgi:twitching motility protein PilT